ncbi:MAG: hypothetical protein HRT73_05620 [Flavobacteriales bacterium]|nr:hypothetical protein [Flavobacteriales bacterium]
MTFIASVIARDGVVVVADSFRTSMEQTINISEFTEYLKENEEGEVNLKSLISLFKLKPSHTRNYAQKMTGLDEQTIVTSSGNAYINGVEVKDVVLNYSKIHKKEAEYKTKKIELIAEGFCKYLKNQVLKHLKDNDYFSNTDFIMSHYSKKEQKPYIFKIRIRHVTLKEVEENSNYEFIKYDNESGYGVVTSGQDRIIDRMLFGSLYMDAMNIARKVSNAIFNELKSQKKTRDRVERLITYGEDFILNEDIKKEIKLVSIRDLSLQEAVDFAALLMKIVMDIQVYTEKTPTVGGQIKLTVIRNEGVKEVLGHEIISPEIVSK